MAALRQHVFVEKVLRRLFPSAPRGQEESTLAPSAPDKPAERVTAEEVLTLAGEDTEAPPARRRLYTASLPPEGYVPAPPEPLGSPAPEDTSGSEDAGGGGQPADDELRDRPKRTRARKHKSRKSFKNPNNDHAEQAELERQQNLFQEEVQPRPADGPTISKNKKRKLKKKQQMKRKKAAGLLTAASGRNFMYQPEGGDSEQEAPGDSAGDDEEDPGEDGTDASEGDIKSTDEKADAILNFLKSTREMYFYDGGVKGSRQIVLDGTSLRWCWVPDAALRIGKEQGLSRATMSTPRTEAHPDDVPGGLRGCGGFNVSRCERESDLMDKIEEFWLCENLGDKEETYTRV